MQKSATRIQLGVDENGLGPQLGPLVATACAIEVPSGADAAKLAAIGRQHGIEDSKASSAFGKMAWAESLSLALVERVLDISCEIADAFLKAVALGGLTPLKKRCPEGKGAAHCWQPLALPAFNGAAERGHRALSALREEGIEVRSIRSEIACVRRYNGELAARRSKLRVDLHLFENLIADAHANLGPADAMCGMVGGIRKYQNYLETSVDLIEEVKGRSSYRMDNGSELTFEVDSDANHLPVALASMVGKYLRELAMHRQNAYLRQHRPSLPMASGYYDPTTRRAVAESQDLRRRLEISDDCFFRNG